MILAYVWCALNGIWPLAHPDHTPLTNPVVLADWMLHVLGLSLVFSWWRARQKETVYADQEDR